MRRWAEFAAAGTLLTRLPFARLPGLRAWPEAAGTIWAYPLIGLLVGAIGGAADSLGWRAGLSPALAAVWALAAMTFCTGALHDDGLADTADGLGGGRDATHRLAIMRDSRIGSHGAIALGFGLAIRLLAIAALARGAVLPVLLVACALGRGGIVLLLALLPPARPDGLAAGLGSRRPMVIAAGLVFAGLPCLLLLPPALAARALVAALLVVWALARIARRAVGGYTGDVLGAGVVAVECAVLSVIAAG